VNFSSIENSSLAKFQQFLWCRGVKIVNIFDCWYAASTKTYQSLVTREDLVKVFSNKICLLMYARISEAVISSTTYHDTHFMQSVRFIALMMEALHTSETSVHFSVTTWCYIPEHSKGHTICVYCIMWYAINWAVTLQMPCMLCGL
jgi:hypothetical protein